MTICFVNLTVRKNPISAAYRQSILKIHLSIFNTRGLLLQLLTHPIILLFSKAKAHHIPLLGTYAVFTLGNAALAEAWLMMKRFGLAL